MPDPDLESLKSFYGRIIRKTMPPEPIVFVVDPPSPEVIRAYLDSDVKFSLAAHDFFEKDRRQYYLSELQAAKQDEARVGMYLNSGFTGEQWPEDFEVEG